MPLATVREILALLWAFLISSHPLKGCAVTIESQRYGLSGESRLKPSILGVDKLADGSSKHRY